jgi:hypothetical protein
MAHGIPKEMTKNGVLDVRSSSVAKKWPLPKQAPVTRTVFPCKQVPLPMSKRKS